MGKTPVSSSTDGNFRRLDQEGVSEAPALVYESLARSGAAGAAKNLKSDAAREGGIMFRLRWLLMAVLVALPAQAQQTSTPSGEKQADNMDIVLAKVQADKKLLVAENMNLTEAEAKGFWPIYEAYQKDLGAINQRLGTTVSAFADAYNKGGNIPDETATKLTNEYLQIEQDEVNLKKSYAKKLAGVIPPGKIARYLQIETKIRSAIKFDMSKNIPLIK